MVISTLKRHKSGHLRTKTNISIHPTSFVNSYLGKDVVRPQKVVSNFDYSLKPNAFLIIFWVSGESKPLGKMIPTLANLRLSVRSVMPKSGANSFWFL